MAYTSKDGSEFSNADGMRHQNRRIDAGTVPLTPNKSAKVPMGGDSSQDQDQDQDQGQGDITHDPKAMNLVGKLSAMGYTADDVSQAMEDEDQDQDSQSGSSDQFDIASALNIPTKNKF